MVMSHSKTYILEMVMFLFICHFQKGSVIFDKSIFNGDEINFSKVDFGNGKVDFRRVQFGDGEINFEEINGRRK